MGRENGYVPGLTDPRKLPEDLSETTLPEPPKEWQDKFLQELAEQRKVFKRALEAILPIRGSREEELAELPESSPLQELQVQYRSDGKKKVSIQPVDVLAGTFGNAFRVHVDGDSPQSRLVAGRDEKRRSLLIANFGLPAIGSHAAIAAADVFIDFSDSVSTDSDSFWLKAGAAMSFDTTDDLYVIGNGVDTVLHCVSVGVT